MSNKFEVVIKYPPDGENCYGYSRHGFNSKHQAKKALARRLKTQETPEGYDPEFMGAWIERVA